MTPIVELRNATKEYRGVPAVKDVSFTLHRGEVHALLGENGAGKSTLTKMIAGVVQPTRGEIWIDGAKAELGSPSEALKRGIAMVYQETSLVPSLTVAQNIYLTDEKRFHRLRGIYIAGQQFLQSLNFHVDPTAHGVRPRRRPEADGRDRARGAPQRPGHHLRRADGDADARRRSTSSSRSSSG